MPCVLLSLWLRAIKHATAENGCATWMYKSRTNTNRPSTIRVCVYAGRLLINSYQIHDEYWDNNYGNCLITLNSSEQEVQSLWMTKRDIWYTKMETIWPIDVREPVTFYKWLLTLSKKKLQKNSNVQKNDMWMKH